LSDINELKRDIERHFDALLFEVAALLCFDLQRCLTSMQCCCGLASHLSSNHATASMPLLCCCFVTVEALNHHALTLTYSAEANFHALQTQTSNIELEQAQT